MLLLIPGQIELHLMLSPTKSAAIPLLRPITAALVDPYTHRLGAPVTGIHTFYRKNLSYLTTGTGNFFKHV